MRLPFFPHSLGAYILTLVLATQWVFDHAGSVEDLEQMFANAVAYLKPGGRFICVHAGDPRRIAAEGRKYGWSVTDLEEIPGGLKMWVSLYGSGPPVEFGGSSMEVLYNGTLDIFERFGLEDLDALSLEDTKLVQSDAEFWKEFVEPPMLRVVTARKGAE